MLVTQYKEYASLGVLFVCVCMLLWLGQVVFKPVSPASILALQETTEAPMVLPGDTIPVELRIPSINLTAPFSQPLGLRVNQEVDVPDDYDTVGWYQHSPLPGQQGPSVVLGHVDSRDGPAVFYSLGQLQIGDEIIVQYASGTQIVFEVTANQRYEQASFPTQLVYGDIDHAGLRLVTCSGWYDPARDRYSHNRIVFAALQQP